MDTMARLHRYDRRSHRRGIAIHASTHVGSFQIEEITGARMLTSVGRQPPIRRPKEWDAVGEPNVPREWNQNGSSVGETVVGKNIGRIAFGTQLETIPTWEFLLVHRTSVTYSCPYPKATSRWLAEQENEDPCWQFSERTSVWQIQPLCCTRYVGSTQREAEVVQAETKLHH